MKLLKTKKIILLTAALGVLITAIVVPVILLNDDENNDQEQQNKKDVDEVIKILEAKNEDEKIITLPSNTKDKIIANNQAKIIEKLKTLIGTQNLKATKIEVSMGEDKNILVTKQEIIIKVSKGKYSKKVAPAKAYFVKRKQNQQEIIADINSVKTALINLNSKVLKLFIEKADKSINANKKSILNTLKQVEGYSEINFKDVKVKVKDDARNLPSSDESAINITFILSKGNVTPVEISIFTIKQLDSEEVQNIKTELNQLKSSLESLSPKIVEVDAPSSNKTITHNKSAIKNAIESLSGYDAIDFDETSLEIKDSNNNLPSNDQEAISIILILSKKGVDVEVRGFSAKQMLFSPTINNEIMTIKTILDGKTGNDLIITLPSDSTGNIIGKEANKNAVERKLRILIDPSNTNGEFDHSSLKGTTISISMTSDTPISTTPQDIVVSISKTGGTTLRTRKTFQVKREITNAEKITNYFANNVKKSITIFGGNVLDTQSKILAAIKKYLANDDGALWTSQLQNLITNHSSESKTSIVKDELAIIYSIAYNDDLGNIQKVDLTINHVSTNTEKITNYFANNVKKTITISGGEVLDTKVKILNAIKKHLANDDSALWTNELQNLITTDSSETETSITKDEPAITYSIAYNDDLGNRQKVDLTINHVSSNAEKITNYFANNAKKTFTISDGSVLDTKAKILDAIKKHLENDDSALWTSELQSLITTHSSETETSILKNGPAITYSIAYNDDLGNIQKVDLLINQIYYTNAEKITNYFANNAKKIITISGGNALETQSKILAAIKKYLANDDGALWTSQLQNLITTHSSETKTSILKDEPVITYSIAYNNDSGNAQKVDLTINHVSTNAEKITNYFDIENNKNIFIATNDELNTKEKILNAIKTRLANYDSALWTSELQNLITTHSSETKTSIAKDGTAITYSIAYNDDSNNTQKVDLLIRSLSLDEV